MVLSIIITSWNTCELLLQCLFSVYYAPPSVTFEVWVVDNASIDRSSKMVQNSFPQVNLIQNTENLGFAPANNQAIRQSTGKYILLLNSDTIVKLNALQALINFLDNHPEAGGAGSKLLNPNGSIQQNCYPEPTLFREFLRMFHLPLIWLGSSYNTKNWDQEKYHEVDIIQGACLMLRKEALDQVGLLDENFFFYSEDFDLCHRLRKVGWHLFWVPTSEVIHYGGQSSQLVAADSFIRLYRGKLQYMRKHHGNLAGAAYKLIILAASLLRLILLPFTFFEHTSRRRQYFSIANHYRRLCAEILGM